MLPIGNLLKSQVRALAKAVGVPQPIIDKAPSAGLWMGQTDEDEMGFPYADLEAYLTHGPEGVAPALARSNVSSFGLRLSARRSVTWIFTRWSSAGSSGTLRRMESR